MKDHFSAVSKLYAHCRPDYPPEIFQYLASLCPLRENAWDCATGNGQAARHLAKYFDRVYASDISAQQLEHAHQASNILYSLQAAEKTTYPDTFFNLVVIAQAIHWFRFEEFYREVQRSTTPGAVVAVLGYGLPVIKPGVDALVLDLYENILNGYWDPERKYIDGHYRSIPFPFEEIEAPAFTNTCCWTAAHFISYLNTWSAVTHYKKKTGKNPVDLVAAGLAVAWGQHTIDVNFPMLLRIGTVRKSAGT